MAFPSLLWAKLLSVFMAILALLPSIFSVRRTKSEEFRPALPESQAAKRNPTTSAAPVTFPVAAYFVDVCAAETTAATLPDDVASAVAGSTAITAATSDAPVQAAASTVALAAAPAVGAAATPASTTAAHLPASSAAAASLAYIEALPDATVSFSSGHPAEDAQEVLVVDPLLTTSFHSSGPLGASLWAFDYFLRNFLF